jgi:MFS family permease
MKSPDVTTPTGHAPPPPSSTTLFFAFGGLMASLAAGYGVLFTIVDDYRDDYGISETAIGAVIGIGFIAAFLSQVLIAPLADRGHARKVVLFGVGVNVAGLLLMGFSTTLVPIMIGRFISGVGIGAAVPAARRIVILADPDHLGQNLGRLIAADVFGFALGPAVSALLVGPFGIPAPFVVVALATAVLVAFVARVQVEESAVAPKRRLAVDLLRIRPFAGAVVFGAALFVMIGSFDALWAVVHRDLGTNVWIANLGITLFALPLIILGPFGGRLAQVHGPFRIAVFGLTIGAFFMASYGVLPTGMWIFAFAMMHAVSDGITVSSSGVAVGMVVPQERQAGAQGVLGAAQALAAGIMAVVTAALYEHFGRSTAYLVCAVVMLVLIAIGGWLARSAWRLNRPLHIASPTVIHDGPTPLSSPTI